MNALPIWDAEQRHPAAPVPGPDVTEAAVPGGARGAALAAAITALEPGTALPEVVERLLDAVDTADAEAGYARVDTADAVLQQRIARIISGASLPSRGPATQARDILSLLRQRPGA